MSKLQYALTSNFMKIEFENLIRRSNFFVPYSRHQNCPNNSLNITYHWSFVGYNLSEYQHFYKMKTYEISCRKVKLSISPWGGNFQFSARDERYVYLKDMYTRVTPKQYKSCLFRRGEIKFSVTRELLNYPRSEFSPCLQGKGEIWVGARFHFGWTCIQKDKFDLRQGRTRPRGWKSPQGETIRVTYP